MSNAPIIWGGSNTASNLQGTLKSNNFTASSGGLVSFNNSANTFATTLQAGSNTANYAVTLPIADGSSGNVLTTNGSGVWSFSAVTIPLGNVAANDSNVVFTAANARIQVCTPTAARTYTLPTTSISAGDTWTFYNQATSSANYITIQSSGSNSIVIVPALGIVTLISAVATPTTAANWIVEDRQSQWVAYTPSFSSGFGTPTNISVFYRLIGDTLYGKGSCTSGTSAAAIASLTIPTGFTISSAKLSLGNTTSAAGNILGSFASSTNGAASYVVSATGTSTSMVYIGGEYSQNPIIPANGSSVIANNATCAFAFEFPVTL